MTQQEMVTDFKVYHHEPVPDKPGYVLVASMSKVKDLIKALNVHLKKIDLQPEEYGFDLDLEVKYKDPHQEIPKSFWRLVAFAVEGSSEGYYVHVGAMVADGPNMKYIDFGVAKTYSADNAYKLATEAQRFVTATEAQRFVTAAEWN